ncbi:hypothetical protein [Massilia consociata]|uniref:Uncharacterized protein n=1 Tax=Massilia consociata TaxID=760117 RepID=A0ABV6FBK5_9BURK
MALALALSGALHRAIWRAQLGRHRNGSRLGAGLWFVTLLLLFYVSYPYLPQATNTKRSASVMLAGGFAAAVYLEENVKVGHELWLTAFTFVAVAACRAHRPRLPAHALLGLTVLLWGALLLLNLVGIKSLNTVLIRRLVSGAMAGCGHAAEMGRDRSHCRTRQVCTGTARTKASEVKHRCPGSQPAETTSCNFTARSA